MDTFEIRVIGEYKRRFKALVNTKQKADTLLNREMIEESNRVQKHHEFLLQEIKAFYLCYRSTLVSHGILPQHPLIIDDITSDEKDTAREWQRRHGLHS